MSHRRSYSVIFADEGNRGYAVQVLKTGPLNDALGSPSWPEIRAAFLSKWMATYGRPILIRLVPAGPFRAKEFQRHIEDFRLKLDPTPGQAHWKNSIAERLIEAHKVTLEGVARAYPELEMQEINDLAAWAHMHCYSHRGNTPGQLLTGAAPGGLEPDPISDNQLGQIE